MEVAWCTMDDDGVVPRDRSKLPHIQDFEYMLPVSPTVTAPVLIWPDSTIDHQDVQRLVTDHG